MSALKTLLVAELKGGAGSGAGGALMSASAEKDFKKQRAAITCTDMVGTISTLVSQTSATYSARVKLLF